MMGLAAALSVGAWIGFLLVRGPFWRPGPLLEEGPPEPEARGFPPVVAVVPARDEAVVLPHTLPTLLAQDYPGAFSVVLVDDRSGDGTGDLARELGAGARRLRVVEGRRRPQGWTGKLWALQQGIEVALGGGGGGGGGGQRPTYLWLTDADIAHDPNVLRLLVARAEGESRDLVSTLVRLHARSPWEKLLVPAFVFFFQKLYPFRKVNRPERPEAGAAGGSLLVGTDALRRAGGIGAIRHELIDDCALARAVQGEGGALWLGHTHRSRSLRAYGLDGLWSTVARTAFTQLGHSHGLLVLTVLGMLLLYAVPPLTAVLGLATGDGTVAAVGPVGWILVTGIYLPTIRLYRLFPAWALSLPVAAFLYTLMTLDSARLHRLGRGGLWKDRVAPDPEKQWTAGTD